MTDTDAVLATLDDLLGTHPPEALPGLLAARPGGFDAALDAVMTKICAGFDPDRTRGEGGVFHYHVRTPDGGADRYVVVADGGYRIAAGCAREPDATVTVAFVDLCRMALGRTTGSTEFRSQRLTITGDIFFAMNWSDWFGAPTPPRR